MVACVLPDRGSLNVIKRPFMHFGNPESLSTSYVLMAKPTPASRLSSLLRPHQKKVYPAPTSLISPTSANRVHPMVCLTQHCLVRHEYGIVSMDLEVRYKVFFLMDSCR